MKRKTLRRGIAVALGLVIAGVAIALVPNAHAGPRTPAFGPTIDRYAAYDGQDTCDPTNKPGVVDVKNMLLDTYGSHTWSISRACNIGGQSEHKEGRALDFGFNYNDSDDRARAANFIGWLFATDVYGNTHAMARRLGVMYIIWNRQIWASYRASSGWQPYSCDGSPSDCHTNHIHLSFSWAGALRQSTWWTAAGPSGLASIYGVLGDGRLTYTNVDIGSGVRTHGAVTSTETLGFVPKAMATLNFNTLLVTSPGGVLHRVDIITNSSALRFSPPVPLGGGWTHSLLSYDGNGHLFGIAGSNGTLRRYTITAAKPSASNIVQNTVIGTGFTLKTMTTTGSDRLLGTTSGGELIAYHVRGVNDWSRSVLRASTWQIFDLMLSPGGGIYFAHTEGGALRRYYDVEPFDGSGSDIYNVGNVDDQGWTQILLSAHPVI